MNKHYSLRCVSDAKSFHYDVSNDPHPSATPVLRSFPSRLLISRMPLTGVYIRLFHPPLFFLGRSLSDFCAARLKRLLIFLIVTRLWVNLLVLSLSCFCKMVICSNRNVWTLGSFGSLVLLVQINVLHICFSVVVRVVVWIGTNCNC